MKAFLSHSSKDKGIYVSTVAERLTERNCYFDSMSFESGSKTLDEILRTLADTDVFVLFISENSLKSHWVAKEVSLAHELDDGEHIHRIFPIIIDETIAHNDPRIPSWLKDNYNLRLITKPTVAVRRIIQYLREISWLKNPALKEQDAIFVGRNDQIKRFEERIDSIDAKTPICVIASGLRGIGRRALLRHCFVKASLWRSSYRPAIIELNSSESIEDFILKASDVGISSTDARGLALTSMSIADKIDLAYKILIEFQKAKEVLMVLDHGGIVNPSHSFAPWFLSLCTKVATSPTAVFCIASTYRPAPAELKKSPQIFHLDVPELEKTERAGLFKRHTELLKLALTHDDLKYFAGLLNGFPEQAAFAANLISAEGVYGAKAASADIADFNTEKVGLIIRDYEADTTAYELLCLLAEFEFISLDFLQTIADDSDETRRSLRSFVGRAICERLGVNGEYLRLNDAIRDYISRRRLGIAQRFRDRLRSNTEEFLKTMTNLDTDVSVVLITLKQALLEGRKIPDSVLIPSHFLKTMKELYDRHQRYAEVVTLADRVLKSQSTLDAEIEREIRYFLCLALARTKSNRFLQEVQIFKGSDHQFLMGFYYRIVGRYDEALARFQDAHQMAPRRANIKRELVTVFLRLGLYEEALAYAKSNYENDQNNPFHMQAYIRCLNHAPKTVDSRTLMQNLLEKLNRVSDPTAQEMHLLAKAEALAFTGRDTSGALRLVEEAQARFPDSKYPRLTELEILEGFGSVADFEARLTVMEKTVSQDSPWYSSILRYRCLLLNKKGLRAQALASLEASDLPLVCKARVRARIGSS